MLVAILGSEAAMRAGKPASIRRRFCGANNYHDGDEKEKSGGISEPHRDRAAARRGTKILVGKVTSVAILGGGTKMAAAAIVRNCKRNKKICLTI